MSFSREQWSALRNAVPMTLTEEDLKELQGINEKLTMQEATDVYLPLSRLLNLYVAASSAAIRYSVSSSGTVSTPHPL
ncbi:pantothenate kinase [Vibrio variabilis]|uniref:Pantothenate kinase n=1 Tax=Vibrio variabilis TaxID=990271 RepID=A0ABQ0JKJ6_9VIBR|nr:pantothenate kinase [Vibrio variabilis]